jgi:hypothetical protein
LLPFREATPFPPPEGEGRGGGLNNLDLGASFYFSHGESRGVRLQNLHRGPESRAGLSSEYGFGCGQISRGQSSTSSRLRTP